MDQPIGSSRRVALITGGSMGIGGACVRQFLNKGWNVATIALPGPDLQRLARSNVLTISGDITSDEIRRAGVDRTIARYGRIDALINNAGIGLYANPSAIPSNLFSRLLDVNVIAPLALAQLVIPIMRRQRSGTIVTVGSVAGRVALPWAAAYCASKAALESVHDSLRRELRNDHIHLLKVCPGIVDTNFRDHVLAGGAPPSVRGIRWVVTPEAVASHMIRAIERHRRLIYVPWIGRVFTLVESVAPFIMDLYLARHRTPMNTILLDTPSEDSQLTALFEKTMTIAAREE